MLSAGSIIGGAFRLIRERPAAIAIWSLLYLVGLVGASFAMRPLAGMQSATLGGDPQFMAANMAMFGRLALFELGFLILFVILMTAAQRAVLRPAEQGLGYIRLGMDELRMLALSLVLIILFYIGFAIAAVLVALIAASAGAVAGAGGAAAVGIVGILLVVGAFVWLEVRLSLAFPLTLLRRKIIIGESWRLSRGRFWTLFGAYLAIFVIIVVISIVGGLVTSGSYVFDMIRNAGNSAGMQQVMQAQMARQFGSITAITVIGWIVNAVLGAVVIALSGGAVATAVRELITDEDSIAETFA